VGAVRSRDCMIEDRRRAENVEELIMDNDHDWEEAEEDHIPDLITRVRVLETLVKNQVAMIQAMEGTLTGEQGVFNTVIAGLTARVAALETEVKALQTKPQEPGLEFKL
jgi:hypothetical protein